PRQPGAERPAVIELAPAPPHDQEHLLDQIAGILISDAVPAEGAVDVVELRLERAGAADELRLGLGPARAQPEHAAGGRGISAMARAGPPASHRPRLAASTRRTS